MSSNFVFSLSLYLLIGISFCASPVTAQETEVLAQIYSTSDIGETTINKANSLAAQMETTKPDSAKSIYAQTNLLSKSFGFDFGQADSYRGLGNVATYQHNYDQAILNYEKAIEIALHKSNLQRMLPQLYNNLGTVKDEIGDYENAMALYQKAIYYKDLVKAASKTEYNTIMLNLAATLFKIKEYDKANMYFDRVKQDLLEKKDYASLCTLLNNQGAVFAQKGELDLGLRYFNESIASSAKYGIDNPSAAINIARIYFLKHEFSKADSLLAHTEQKMTMNLVNSIEIQKLRGQMYFEKGMYPEALNYLQKALDASVRLKIASNIMELNLYLYKCYKMTGEHANALKYFEQYTEAKDSFTNAEIVTRSNVLESKIRISEKEKDISGKQLTIYKQKTTLKMTRIVLAVSLAGILFLLPAFFFFRKNSKNKNKLLKIELENKLQQASLDKHNEEMQLLKASIAGEERERARIARELHDGIGGMLSSLKIYTTIQSGSNYLFQGKMSDMINNTADEVRRIAHNLMPDALLRNGIEHALLSYTEMLNESSGINISATFQHLDFEWDTTAELMVYRMAQELLQNILKHANASEVSLLLKNYNGNVSLIVEDNGVGFDPENIDAGMGWENIRNRLASVSGTADVVSSVHQGTIVHLVMDVEKLKKRAEYEKYQNSDS